MKIQFIIVFIINMNHLLLNDFQESKILCVFILYLLLINSWDFLILCFEFDFTSIEYLVWIFWNKFLPKHIFNNNNFRNRFFIFYRLLHKLLTRIISSDSFKKFDIRIWFCLWFEQKLFSLTVFNGTQSSFHNKLVINASI
jgi:hypothetical protein